MSGDLYHKKRPVVQAWQYLVNNPTDIIERLGVFGQWEATSSSFTFVVSDEQRLTVTSGEWIVYDATDWAVMANDDFRDTYEATS